MILSKIYAQGGNFYDVSFHPGVNIILGTCTRSGEEGADSHNLGKTLLFEIIDFCLLGDVPNDHVFNEKLVFFQNYIFYLEIRLNDNSYLTIRRGVANKNVASFNKFTMSVDCRNVDKWQHEDVSIAAKKKQSARDLLKNLLEIKSFADLSFRSLLSYSMRMQDNYVHAFNIYNAPKDIIWKPRLLTLIGLNGRLLKEKLLIDEQKSALEKTNKLLIDTGIYDSPETVSARRRLDELVKEKNQIESSIDNISFFDEDRDISRSIVKDYDSEISKLNMDRYKLLNDLQRLSRTVESNFIDLEEIKSIYSEMNIVMPENLVKNYDELLDFNKKIWADRQGFILNQIDQMKLKCQEIDEQLYELDGERKELLAQLKKQDVINRYKKRRLDVVKIDTEIEKIKEFLSSIMDADLFERQKGVLKGKQKKDIKALIEMQLVGTVQYAKFVDTFNGLVKEMLGYKVKFKYDVSTKGNVNFNMLFEDKESEILLLHKGTTYRKMLSICFDIALLLMNAQDSKVEFLAHDGVWDTLSDILKEKHIRMVRELSNATNCQFILTMLTDDIPSGYHKDDFFSEDEIILELDDRDNDIGRLFKALF